MRLYTHTHTHTSDFIENNRKNKLTNNQSNLVVCIKHATTGITLVALIVTIVVLLILAGITLTYVMGDNSVFNRASEAKLKTDIANWKEKLELAKGPVFIDGLGTLNPDKYFEYIEEQGIIEDKEKDVFDNEDGTYDVTTKPGYIFQIEFIDIISEKHHADQTELLSRFKFFNLLGLRFRIVAFDYFFRDILFIAVKNCLHIFLREVIFNPHFSN